MTEQEKIEMTCCVECFDYDGIKAYIEEVGEIGNCSYCGCEGIAVADTQTVGEFIKKCFDKKYQDAANSVGYESAEGGYNLATHMIDEILLDEMPIFSGRVQSPEVLCADLVSLDGTGYVRRDPYGPGSAGGDLIRTWEKFSEAVKTNRRYTVFLLEKPRYESSEHIPTFLEDLANLLAMECSTTLEKGKAIYRGRILESTWSPSHETLTNPKKQNTVNNRMSPKGVSFFYGALDIDTVTAEVRPPIGASVVIASFELLKPLKLIDLGSKIQWRDIFNGEYDFGWDEHYAPFLKKFIELISKPLASNDPQIDYLPTQVFTEYLRFHPKLEIDGMLYGSAQNKGGVNVVLFKEDDISSQDSDDKDAWLLFSRFEVHEIGGIKYTSRIIRSS